MLNLSGYFDEHRDEYIDALREVTTTRSYKKWVEFFLVAVKEQGEKNLAFIERLRLVEKEDSLVLNERLRSPAASHILRHALNKLYITVPSTVSYLKAQHVTSADVDQVARTNIQRMVEEGILAESTFKFGRAKVYVHKKLGDIMFKKRQEAGE